MAHLGLQLHGYRNPRTPWKGSKWSASSAPFRQSAGVVTLYGVFVVFFFLQGDCRLMVSPLMLDCWDVGSRIATWQDHGHIGSMSQGLNMLAFAGIGLRRAAECIMQTRERLQHSVHVQHSHISGHSSVLCKFAWRPDGMRNRGSTVQFSGRLRLQSGVVSPEALSSASRKFWFSRGVMPCAECPRRRGSAHKASQRASMGCASGSTQEGAA